MGNVGLGVGYVTRIWRVEWELAGSGETRPRQGSDEDGARLRAEERLRYCEILAKCDPDGKLYHWILLRHYESGKVAVFVDGAFEGTGHASFSSAELKYRVGDRVVCTRIGFNEKSKFAYSFDTSLLEPNGSQVPLKELNETLMSNHDPDVVTGSVTTAEVDHVVRPGQAVAKAVVMYHLQASVRGEPTVAQRKRFSEFVDLDRLVRSAFHGSHLLSSLPSLPPKQSKVLSNHLEPAFIERRRAALDLYLRKLLTVPRIAQNPDVLEFLGVLPAAAASSAPPEVVV